MSSQVRQTCYFIIYLSGNAKCFDSSSIFASPASVSSSILAAPASVGPADDGPDDGPEAVPEGLGGRLSVGAEAVPEGFGGRLSAGPSPFSFSSESEPSSIVAACAAESGGVEPPWKSSVVEAPMVGDSTCSATSATCPVACTASEAIIGDERVQKTRSTVRSGDNDHLSMNL